ncbi:hypothetical protein HMPREF3185_00859 [Porphyromonas somerae]|uniref:Uncharacterized protein n=1 Tax=Porphyromonas somerae TaxID=322095 RepID=A0A134B9Q5_9PORP|nr:hypothetical protein HMPREF3184_00859 [Porphyromonadaceae bacterium KA00676]KXB76665.1 hypothetical protein HMPREF3185_00859 [Porphyromonas somerae]
MLSLLRLPHRAGGGLFSHRKSLVFAVIPRGKSVWEDMLFVGGVV